MLHKISQELIFVKKRDSTLITPCCHKDNKDGKFVNFKGYNSLYGYCHSCGVSTLPPTLYRDDSGNEFKWNTVTQQFENVLQFERNNVIQTNIDCNTKTIDKIKYIDFEYVTKTVECITESALLVYLRKKYCNTKVDKAIKMYYIGTSKKKGTVFWFINKSQKAQKAKVSYYKLNGKRSNFFEVPYKNEDGYKSCLYGEHLLLNNNKPIILVESEKTAIVASIEFPQYTWLSYSGINGLTDSKLQVLKGERVLLIPDVSKNAVSILQKKLKKFERLNIDATIFDMTFNKSDDELKAMGCYNIDIEDILRSDC